MLRRSRILFITTLSVFAFCASQVALRGEDSEGAKPKHPIKEIMKTAMKGGLAKKVAAGKASDEEKKQLLDMFLSLVEHKPKKGEMESWHKLAGNAAMAAAKVSVGREGAEKQLAAAIKCATCHKVHK